MKRNLMLAAVSALAFLGANAPAVGAQAHERHLKKSDLPLAVQKTVDEQSRAARIRGYSSEMDEGKLQYEVEMTVNGHSRDVSIAPDGSVLAVEEQVELDALPPAVRTGLQAGAGGAKITKVESITKHGSIVAYEAELRTGKTRSELQVGPDGQPLTHRE
jgi:hypothetical protein